MDNQPVQKPKSKKIWWILGGVAFVVIAAATGGNPNSQAPAAGVAPTVQTANVVRQVAQPATVQPEVQSMAPAPVVQPAVQSQAQPQQNDLSNDNYYTNSDGNTVHSPAYSNTIPVGATAQCRDKTYSFSQHRSGTCSGHGGVATWL